MVVDFEILSKCLLPGGFIVVVDGVSLLVGAMVLFISSCVLCYCGFYMRGDIFLSRFMGLLVLFVGSMCWLVFCPELVGMMVGWDGLGVSSFLLVVYYINKESLSAGMLTALTNRLGDVLFVLGIRCAACVTGSVLFSGVFFQGL